MPRFKFSEDVLLKIMKPFSKNHKTFLDDNGQFALAVHYYIKDNFGFELTLGAITKDTKENFETLYLNKRSRTPIYYVFIEYGGKNYDSKGEVKDPKLLEIAQEYNDNQPTLHKKIRVDDGGEETINKLTRWENKWTYYYNKIDQLVKRLNLFNESYKWKPSKSARKDFANKMEQIKDFCYYNNISYSKTSDSYYFTIDGKNYRVSNHTVQASDKGMYDEFGNKIRNSYHSDKDEIQIFASKTRIMDIYNDLKNGKKLDKRGNKIL